MVEEAAAVGVGVERPATGVDDQAFLVHLRLDLPQLLEADAVGLHIAAIVQVEVALQLLAKVAAAAFGEKGVPSVQFHAELESRAFAPIL